jgi:hypothetical protein
MPLFDERERAFENLFAHEEGLRFRTRARRNQLFGRWAAEQLGLRGSECQAYVRSFVDAAVRPESDEALIERVRWDLVGCDDQVSEERIRGALVWATNEATRQVRTETRAPVT